MKWNVILITILLYSTIIIHVHAIDTNSSGTAHPSGITSSGLGTTIDSNENIFNISGGTQKGLNLFHSFGKFNLHTGESAFFNDSGIQNTIGRVTGADYSWINGNITSSTENLYLINPSGVMFGSDVTLDVHGSFHVGKTDYKKI